MLQELPFDQFRILYEYKKNSMVTQRDLARRFSFSVGKVHQLVSLLEGEELLVRSQPDNGRSPIRITDKGIEALAPYKVENAIIMAAGFASRCAPLSYEKPKGLFKVRDEILVERLIEQLQSSGIHKIYLVVGYMKELFFYLEKKYGVQIITNADYYRRNNLSSIYAAKAYFGNSYVCYSDNYHAINGYEEYVYRSYFAAQYSEQYTDEYIIRANKKGLITQYYQGGEKCWYQMGEMYFDRKTATRFIQLMEEEYNYPFVSDMKVDDFYIRHLSDLDVYIKEMPENAVAEFDTIAEIERFDNKFVQNMGENILTNICSSLGCKEDEIRDVKQITRGNTNVIFSFAVGNERYVYRHPGRGSDAIIDRQKEYLAIQKAAELGLDPTLIACDPRKGWKLSRFIDNIDFDYDNLNDEHRGVEIIRRLHSGPVRHRLGFELNMLTRADEILSLVPVSFLNSYNEFASIKEEITILFNLAAKDGYEIEMSHNDCCDSNIILGKKSTYLIDWEYAGDNDPAVDIATFIIGCTHTREDVNRILHDYFQRELSSSEYRHYLAFIAISAYFYFCWGIYEESIGKDVGDLTYIWYNYLTEYGKLAIKLYDN